MDKIYQSDAFPFRGLGAVGREWYNLKVAILLPTLTIVCAIVWLIVLYAFLSSRPKNFPPGPPTVPFLGNLHLVPPEKSCITFQELTKRYGPLLGLKFGPANVLVLNDYRDVQALMEGRSAIYSSRPDNYIAQQILYPNDLHMLFARDGTRWKSFRKAVQSSVFSPRALANVIPIQDAESTKTIHDLLHTPQKYYPHLQRFATGVVLTALYGQHGPSCDSPIVQGMHDILARLTALIEPGAAPPVDFYTFLQYCPEFCAPWKKKARILRKDESKLYAEMMNRTKSRMAEGKKTGCYVEELIMNAESNGLSDEQIAYLGGSLMQAGTETSFSALMSFFLGMVKNPEALKRAQDEVDQVCGAERLPVADDLPKLQYVEACMNEVSRWRPSTPGGVPHMLTRTDNYKGYVIPAGTMVMCNAWAINHNEHDFIEPDNFNPDRWIGSRCGMRLDKPHKDDESRKKAYVFGAGRRICAGQKFAEISLKLSMAKIVWAFDIAPSDGVDKKDIDASVHTAFEGGFTMAPKEFPAKISSRSAERAKIVEREFDGLQSFFAKYL